METAPASKGHILWSRLGIHGVELAPLFEQHGATGTTLFDPNQRIATDARGHSAVTS